MNKSLPLAAILLLASMLKASALVTITVDENGHGDWSGAPLFPAGALANDTGPGGKPNALTYYLGNAVPPFGMTIGSLVPGDLFILESPGGPLSDLIRFRTGNPAFFTPASLVFYSDNTSGAHALADIGFPTAFNPNTTSMVEGALEITHYTPLSGQPGYVDDPANPGHSYVAYNFISSIPEPTTAALVGTFLMLTVWAKRRRF